MLSASGMLVMLFGPSLARTMTKSVQFVTQNCKINNFFVNRHFRGQNYDVPEVPLFRIKIHENDNFSTLASRGLLKLHKSLGSSAVRTKTQEF